MGQFRLLNYVRIMSTQKVGAVGVNTVMLNLPIGVLLVICMQIALPVLDGVGRCWLAVAQSWLKEFTEFVTPLVH